MTQNHSAITIHMVSSLDGYVAKKDGDVSWLESKDYYKNGLALTDDDIKTFLDSIDCYVMGSRTYEQALQLGWPYGDVPVYVLSNRQLSRHKKSVKFYAGDLIKFFEMKLKPNHKNIWLVGGPSLAKECIRLGLADQIVMSILPVILGEGIPFFDSVGLENALHLKDVKAYSDGMVELSYEIKKEAIAS